MFSLDLKRTLITDIESQVQQACLKCKESKIKLNEAKKQLDKATVLHEPTQMLRKEVDVLEMKFKQDFDRAVELIDELPMQERDKWTSVL
jgi:FKBP-type peptidyl-prolyl cis-trans isomerase (trigger factor)